MLLQDGDLADEYLPIEGLALYLEMSQRLVFGAGATATMERRVASVQTLSGTGALHLGALFLSRFLPVSESKKVYVSDPPYVNHVPILRHADLEVGSYPYYSATTRSIDFGSLCEKLWAVPHIITRLCPQPDGNRFERRTMEGCGSNYEEQATHPFLRFSIHRIRIW